MEQFINRPAPARPVSTPTFTRETIPLQIKHKPKNEEFNCSICFDILACDPSEVDSLTKDDIKLLKNRFEISEPDLYEIKQKLKEKLCDGEVVVKDSVVIKKCGHSFHTVCIQKWFKEHNTCPLCRLELNEVKNDKNYNNNNGNN